MAFIKLLGLTMKKLLITLFLLFSININAELKLPKMALRDNRDTKVTFESQIHVPAKAKIAGRTIIISSPEISKPVAVRYAWKMAPLVNLVGDKGLPASPFKTDNFKLPEKNP